MSVIKPRTRGKRLVKHRTRAGSRRTRRPCTRTQHMIGESTEYVLNQLIDTVLAKDKEFVAVASGPSAVVCPASGGSAPG